MLPFLAVLLFIMVMALFIRHEKRKHLVVEQKIAEAKEGGTYEPVSIHPYIDPNKCIGSGACVKACHEKDVIGVSGGKGRLINAALCIGHGACAAACPVGAISLVFGTAKRGVEIPAVSPDFETNVPGLYIAGELGGMGLIRNAIVQGCEATDNLIAGLKQRGSGVDDEVLDVFIVGAGPAGIGSTLTAMKNKLKYVTIDQEDFGGTVYNFPVRKIVMTAPVELPLYGKVQFKETTKEDVLKLWNKIRSDTGLLVRTKEKLTGVEREGGDGVFKITTTKGEYRSRRLLLCLGRRGTPRKLGVPGEELSKVSYRLIDPAQHSGEEVLVVGGGDSAVEAAISIAAEGNNVTLSYRKEAFGRIKQGNKERLGEAAKNDNLNILLNSNLLKITEGTVELDVAGQTQEMRNDYVYVFAGGELPNKFLKSIGLQVETHHGRPL